MTKLFLVRHGESTWNPIRRLQGTQDTPLSDKGKLQAERLGQRFRSIPLDAIYSSHLTRAFETAEAVSRSTGLPVTKEDGLQEIGFGEWEGVFISEVDLEGYRSFLQYWVHRIKNQPVPGAEPLEICRDRMSKTLFSIIQRHPNQNIAVVSHGSALSVFFHHILEAPLENIWRMVPGNCSISLVSSNSKGLKINLFNDICHLEDRPI